MVVFRRVKYPYLSLSDLCSTASTVWKVGLIKLDTSFYIGKP